MAQRPVAEAPNDDVLTQPPELRVDAWLVIAMDNSTCPALMGTSSDNDGSACVFPYHSSKTSVITGGGGVATYRSQDFNRTC